MNSVIHQSFLDELEKIGAQKCRAGSMPISAHNLANKQVYDGRDKVRTKLSFVQLAKDVLGKGSGVKNTALIAGGALGALALNRAYGDWSLGRQVRKSQGG